MIIRKKTGLLAKKIDGKLVIFDIRSGKLYTLNETAAFIWRYVKKPRTLNELIDEMSNEYNISRVTARKDIQTLIQRYKGGLFSVGEGKELI